MKFNRIIPFLAIAFACSPVMAADFSYDYFDGGYQILDLEGVDGDGLRFEYGKSVMDNYFIKASYKMQSFDEGGFELDWNVLDVGFGGYWTMAPNLDLTAAAGFAMIDMEVTTGFGSGSDDDTGFFLEPGMRFMATDQLELHASAYYIDAFDDSETQLNIGARYMVMPNMSVNFAYLDEGDMDGFQLGARWNF